MVGHDSKIYRVVFTIALCLVCRGAVLTAGTVQEKMTLFKLKLPVYQNDSAVPVVILYADEAKPIGVNFELKGVELDWIGVCVSDVRGVVTTPSAVYDRPNNMITGNQWIKYRSKEMDLDGVGFDIDQTKQTIHIRSGVKVVIKDKFESNRQKRLAGKKRAPDRRKPAKQFKVPPALTAIVKPDAAPAAPPKKVVQKKKAPAEENITIYIRAALICAIVFFVSSWLYTRFKRRGN
jgi:hypothetical protein